MRKVLLRVLPVAMAGIVLLSAGACGVPQAEVDTLKQQLAAKEQEATAAKQEAARAKQYSVLSAVPDAPPRKPAPPPQPGVTPPPPPTPPPAKVVPLFFYVDTVTAAGGESKYKVDASLGCARTSIFKRGQRIVWRMEVVDTSTGKVLQATDVKSAVLKLPHGEEVRFSYGRHGASANAPWFWALGWDAPLDYPLGVMNYRIEVTTNDGKVGTFTEMNLLPQDAQALTLARDGRVVSTAGLTIAE